VFDRYGLRGVKSFTLEVDALNAPALRLYEKLGFRQYATVTYMQMEKAPEVKGLPVPGLRPYQRGDAQALFELHLACTPAPVRLVDTRKPGDFALGFVERAMAGMRRRMKHVADERFVVEVDGKVVAYMRVMAQMRALPHTVHLMVNPGFDHLYVRCWTTPRRCWPATRPTPCCPGRRTTSLPSFKPSRIGVCRR
jgi:hypothetical protein